MVRAGFKEAHPAGIWSDRTIDGPVIGTLVVILDKAKNLPNKKKIGKQDPYAVARLAKEGKRTDADLRGGQTPKWDKELRFPVRDSPDYKSLKISVFADDKKVELIGECNIRLDQILVKGGGTDDGWRVLKYKERYAGDILVELTFWDMRPKDDPDTATRKKRVSTNFEKKETTRGRVGGAREMGTSREKTVRARTRDGRRPLPDDPMSSREDLAYAAPPTSSKKHGNRHLHQPPMHTHTRSEPQLVKYRDREHRHSTSALVDSRGMALQNGSMERLDMYDPYNHDNFIPGQGYDDLDPYQQQQLQPPPPPPPQHSRSLPMLPQLPQGEVPQDPYSQGITQEDYHALRHRKSTLSWQHSAGSQISKRHSSYDTYGGGYSPQDPYAPQDPYMQDPYMQYSSSPAGSFDNRMSYHQDMPHQLPPPPSDDLSGPPPPPPPHRRSLQVQTGNFDEPNWDNHRPRSTHDEYGLPPAYEPPRSRGNSMTRSRRNSFVPGDISPVVNGSPVPPSLIPGVDPALAEELAEMERRQGNGAMQPLSITHVPVQYQPPQVEDAQDPQSYSPYDSPQGGAQRPRARTLTTSRTPPMVKPMPIHGERDSAVPVVNASKSSVTKNHSLALIPERKPVPGGSDDGRALTSTPFGPDSYDLINPNPAASLAAMQAANTPQPHIMPGSSRAFTRDPSDVLGPETFAPEPEKKKPRPPPPVPAEHRRTRLDASRSSRYSLPAPEPKHVVVRSPSEDRRASIRDPPRFSHLRNSKSMAMLPSSMSSRNKRYSTPAPLPPSDGGMVLYDPYAERRRQMEERDRERESRALMPAMGMSPGRGGGNNMAMAVYGRPQPAPPVPAKIPMQPGMTSEDYLLSQEMSMISIGPVGERTRRGRY